jgi:hypothetical protein
MLTCVHGSEREHLRGLVAQMLKSRLSHCHAGWLLNYFDLTYCFSISYS